MNNKSWKTLYEEVIQKIEKINTTQKKEVEDQTENINIMINNIQTLRDKLIQQLENKGVKDIDKNAKFSELIQMIGKIESGGSASCDAGHGAQYLDFNTHLLTMGGMNDVETLEPGMWFQLSPQGLENVSGSLPPFRGVEKVVGLNDSKFIGEFPLFPDLTIIGSRYENHGFGASEFSGTFPVLPEIYHIGEGAFFDSKFTGEFPNLPQLHQVHDSAFYNSKFTGEFPSLPSIFFIYNEVFYSSEFTGEFPLTDVSLIGNNAFYNSKFTGEFPNLLQLRHIFREAFYNSNFTGEFPLFGEYISSIGENAFYNSNFDKDEDGFIKNYPGWDGKSEWRKPFSYRAAMKDTDAPKLMSIIPPGTGEIQVLNEEAKLAQSIRRDEYLKENEPSDIDYYLSYTKKLKEIGFERDEYGNYIDMINDKSVIIIPEDIKFLV